MKFQKLLLSPFGKYDFCKLAFSAQSGDSITSIMLYSIWIPVKFEADTGVLSSTGQPYSDRRD